MNEYLEHHLDWEKHYCQLGKYGPVVVLLRFNTEWSDIYLTDKTFQVDLLDGNDNKVYTINKSINDSLDIFGNGSRSIGTHTLRESYCQCQRKINAKMAGANTDLECSGNRFRIQRVVAPSLPDLILYSETMSIEELEDILKPKSNFLGMGW